jgi:hypothetical protein
VAVATVAVLGLASRGYDADPVPTVVDVVEPGRNIAQDASERSEIVGFEALGSSTEELRGGRKRVVLRGAESDRGCFDYLDRGGIAHSVLLVAAGVGGGSDRGSRRARW